MLWEGRRPALVWQQSPSFKSLLDFIEISEMDRVNTHVAGGQALLRDELSKNSWLLGIQFPDCQKASIQGEHLSAQKGATVKL